VGEELTAFNLKLKPLPYVNNLTRLIEELTTFPAEDTNPTHFP
jgi:hypothetical protein